MRHAAITFAEQVDDLLAEYSGTAPPWDVVVCTDMLNLLEFKGQVDERIRRLPTVLYFHENQLTYPVREERERDYHFGFTNIVSYLSAHEVWFNSDYHRRVFRTAAEQFLKRMPAPKIPIERVGKIPTRTQYPGIPRFSDRPPRKPGPIRLVWAARWEHDKNPEDFFNALQLLKEPEIPFTIDVLGQQYDRQPEVFSWAREYYAENIRAWGYVKSRERYREILREADVFVSTAKHEFFGITTLEAIAAGAYPLLPERLVYPELLQHLCVNDCQMYLYDGSVGALAQRLRDLTDQVGTGENLYATAAPVRRHIDKFFWSTRARAMDSRLQRMKSPQG